MSVYMLTCTYIYIHIHICIQAMPCVCCANSSTRALPRTRHAALFWMRPFARNTHTYAYTHVYTQSPHTLVRPWSQDHKMWDWMRSCCTRQTHAHTHKNAQIPAFVHMIIHSYDRSHVHVCMRTRTHTHARARTHIHTHTHIFVCMCACVCLCVCVYVCVCVCVCMCM